MAGVPACQFVSCVGKRTIPNHCRPGRLPSRDPPPPRYLASCGAGESCAPGFHGANDQEPCIDWLDVQFGRTTRKWTNDFLFPWNFAEWKKECVVAGLKQLPMNPLAAYIKTTP